MDKVFDKKIQTLDFTFSLTVFVEGKGTDEPSSNHGRGRLTLS